MIPAIKMIKKDAPDVKVGVVFPFDRKTKELQQVSDFYHTTRKEILPNFRLPDTITKENGKRITCPLNGCNGQPRQAKPSGAF